MLFSTTQIIFASVASITSVLLVLEVLSLLVGTVRRHWAKHLLCTGSHTTKTLASNAYIIEVADTTPIKADFKPEHPTRRGANSDEKVHLDEKASASTPTSKNVQLQRKVLKVKFVDIPKNLKTMNNWPATGLPKQQRLRLVASVPRTSARTDPIINVQGAAQGVLGSNRDSARHSVLLPVTTPVALRASQSAPARMSRTTRPSQARRIVPTKRLVSPRDDEVEPTHTKRLRLFHSYASPVQTAIIPPQRSVSALPIPSPLSSNSPPTSIASSDSVMSPSELTYERQVKRARPTLGPATRHEVSSSGKPGALPRVSLLATNSTEIQDVEMLVADALETPELTISSPDMEMHEWSEREALPPPNPVFDEDMRSPFDDDVEMGEWKEVCAVMVGVYVDEDIMMRDWTDEDVEMVEVT
ncbi:unnamed protein product [Rhizoctonia solani]|uniref:Uncharacterized protein n=1 Tax=Rhizoctonia solani TaxID=456999 RepID=A0A8H2XLC0_9AGAM|nr:unnamed protein product [Rhizoctonia solani]